MPLSLVGTLAVMYLFGFSLEQSVADGADHRHRLRRRRRHRRDREHRALPRGGRRRRCEAALKGSAQIGFTIISLTVSLIAVLIPLLFMGDVVGRLFREFAITLAVTILISAVVSLTLVPMACAKLLKPATVREQRAFSAQPRRSSTGHRAATAARCDWVLDRQTLMLLVALGHARADGVPLRRHPEGILPAAGHRRHPGDHRGAAVDFLRARWRSGSRRWPTRHPARIPTSTACRSFIGVDGTNTTLNSGRILINLKPRDQRTPMSPSDHRGACRQAAPRSRASRSTCSRCRI